MQKSDQRGIAHPVLVLAVVAVCGVTGLAGYQVLNGKKSAQLNSSQSSAATKAVLPESLEGIVPVSSLEEIVGETDSVQVAGVELKVKNGVLVYEVTMTDGTEHTVNAKTGEKSQTETKAASSDDSNRLPATLSATLGFEEARVIAQKQLPSSKIEKIQLELEEGKLVYSVRFADKARVDVYAADGSIVRTKQAKEVKATPGVPNSHASPTAISATSKETGKSVKSGSSSKTSSSGTSGSSSESGSSTSGSDDGASHSGSGSNDDSESHSGSDDSGSGSHSGSGH